MIRSFDQLWKRAGVCYEARLVLARISFSAGQGLLPKPNQSDLVQIQLFLS